MALFESTLALLLGAVILTGLARRVGVPYPSLLAIAGAALAFAPAGPELDIEPDLALALFVAPVLLDAAFDTSPRDLRRNVIPLASLVVVAVGLTTAAVAWVGWRLGGLPIAAAIALGAIVAPPQAAPRGTAARNVGSTYSVWETAVFVLNVLAFVIMGLQARPILDRLSRASLSHALLVSGVVLATVIVVRITYVMAYNTIARLKNRWFGVALRPGTAPTTVAGGVLVSWCGMRGLVTLATAFALPSGFPGRDLIVLSAFCVVLGTLVIQGFTLRPLLDNLGFEADGAVEREISHGRLGIMQAALDTLAGEGSPAAAAVREGYLAAREVAASPEEPQGATEYDHLRLRAIAAQRRTLHQLREEGSIGDEAFHRLEEEVDWAELDAAPAGSFQPLTTDGAPPELRAADRLRDY